MVSSSGYMSRRGRDRGSAILVGVSAGSNSWRRGQPLTSNAAGPFASSNSWVRPKDDNAEQKNDAEKTEKAVSAVDLALASIEGNANDKEGPMVLPQNKTVSTEAIDGNNTDGTSKSKARLEKTKFVDPPKKRPKNKPQPMKSKPNKDYNTNESKSSVEVDTSKIDSLRRNILDAPPKKPILKGGPKPVGGSKVWRRKNDKDNINGKGIGQPKQQPPPSRHGEIGRSTNHPVTKAPAAKRIRLGKGSMDGTDQSDADGTIGDDTGMSEGQAKRDDNDIATLTAFAYRETGVARRGRERGRGRGRGRGSTNISSGNTGLVRVKSELQSTTKICPTFARGINCDNEFCRKRHDIPPECARPLCSFFQRHGQCRKGDGCPFAHIKVDPRAAVCSSFRLLGYCEDPNCAFKHVQN